MLNNEMTYVILDKDKLQELNIISLNFDNTKDVGGIKLVSSNKMYAFFADLTIHFV